MEEKECPISGEICGEHCAWYVNDECVMTKSSYTLMIIAKELQRIREGIQYE